MVEYPERFCLSLSESIFSLSLKGVLFFSLSETKRVLLFFSLRRVLIFPSLGGVSQKQI